MSLQCISIRSRSLKGLVQKIRTAEKDADLIEIWIDDLSKKIEPHQLLKLSRRPFLIANKSQKERGSWQGKERDRLELLKKYADAGADFIDIDLRIHTKMLKDFLKHKKRTRIILSYHNFKKTPPIKTLWQLTQKGFKLGADIVKIATTARNLDDNLVSFQLLAKAKRKKQKLIAFCMGEKGKISRLLAPLYNSYMMYFALDEKSRIAPGQLTIKEFNQHKLDHL